MELCGSGSVYRSYGEKNYNSVFDYISSLQYLSSSLIFRTLLASFSIFLVDLIETLNAMEKPIINYILFIATLSAVNAQQCFTPDQKVGECLEFKSCKSLYDLIQQVPLLDTNRRHLSLSQCGWVNRSPLVCCPLTDIPDQKNNSSTSLLPPPGVCGMQTSDRIIGGDVTKIAEFPWAALIEYSRTDKSNEFYCGGALINNLYVLTAAHCIIDIPPEYKVVSVRLGEWNLTSERDCEIVGGEEDCSEPVQDIPADKIITHEKYDPSSKNKFNDIALIRLARKVQYTDYVKPICLPNQPSLRNKDYATDKFDVTGWGRTLYKSKSNLKLKVTIPVVEENKCKELYQKNLKVEISNNQICAGGVEGKDSCKGDSGGPLMGRAVVDKTPFIYLAGIVSYGPGRICGMDGWPGVYTKVSSYIDWIESKLAP